MHKNTYLFWSVGANRWEKYAGSFSPFVLFPPSVYQVIRALQEAGRRLLVICMALNKDWICYKSPLILPPPHTHTHFNSPWLLPTPIKHYNHKNPQALKSCPGGCGWGGLGEESTDRNILLFTPLNHSVRRTRERWRGGYIVSDGPAD